MLATVAIRNYLQFPFTDLMSNTSYAITVTSANELGNGTVTVLDVTTVAVPQDSEGVDIIFVTHCNCNINVIFVCQTLTMYLITPLQLGRPKIKFPLMCLVQFVK